MNMRKTMTWTIAMVAAASMALAGCGGNGAGDASASKSGYVQPADGVPSDYTGTLPAPDASKAYNNPQERDNIQDGGTLTLATTEIGPNWNANSTDGNSVYMNEFWSFYQPHLWDYSFDGKATPNPDFLSKVTLTSEDPMVVTYDINPDAKWNDGSEIDYTAFQSTWNALNGKDSAYNPPMTTGYDQIASVEKGESDKQVVVTFETPFYPYTGLFNLLVNPKAADADTFTQGWINDPHTEWAAGPFVVDSFDDSQVTFTPNPNWWGDKPKLDKVVFKQMESSAAINAFHNGEIDAVGASTADNLKIVRSMDDVQIRIGYSKSTDVLTYNGTADALKDIAVRKAITQGFDQKTWSKIRYQGTDYDSPQPGSECMLVFQDGYENNLPKDSGYDVDAAKKTLEDAGYTMGDDGYYQKDGKPVKISYTYFGDDANQTALANAYQKMMKDIGVDCEIVNLDNSEFSKTLISKSFEVLAMGWSASDPYGYSTSGYQLYGSDSDSNYSFIGASEIDAMLKKPSTMSDTAEAIAAFNEAEKAAFEQYGTIPIDVRPSYLAVKKGLANFGPAGFANCNNGIWHTENIGWQKEA